MKEVRVRVRIVHRIRVRIFRAMEKCRRALRMASTRAALVRDMVMQ